MLAVVHHPAFRAEIPDGHPLCERFSCFSAGDRSYFEDLVARQSEASGWRRGPAGQRDRERLIGLDFSAGMLAEAARHLAEIPGRAKVEPMSFAKKNRISVEDLQDLLGAFGQVRFHVGSLPRRPCGPGVVADPRCRVPS